MTNLSDTEKIRFYGECAMIGGMMLVGGNPGLCIVHFYRAFKQLGVKVSCPEQLPQIEDDEAFKGVLSCLYVVSLKRAGCWPDTDEVE